MHGMVEADARGGSGRAWWKRTRVVEAEVGGLGEVVVAGRPFMCAVEGDRKI
jgi:hypothetical protein